MKTVLPGESLAREEEFEPGAYSFSDDDGTIRASVAGAGMLDSGRHVADVKPRKPKEPLQVGAIALGRVVMIKPSACVIEIFDAVGKNGLPQVTSGVWASVPVHKIARQYVKSVRDCFRIGDIVRARITLVTPYGIDGTTAEPGLGVVQAYCSRCRHPLQSFGVQLRCTNCGASEIRKIAQSAVVSPASEESP